MKKCICIVLILALLILSTSATMIAATIYTFEGYSYTFLPNGMASICGWDNSDSNFVVPDQVAGHYVFEVDRNGIQSNTFITSLDFTQATKLNTIGGYAFEGCSSVDGTLFLPRKVGFIGDAAFMNCSSVDKLIYQAITDTISRQCFRNCYSLQEVEIAEGPTEIEAYAFQNCGLLKSVLIPKSVNKINSTAFSNCGEFVVKCYTGSYAQQYAEDKGIDYVLIDVPEPTEPPTEVPTEEPTVAPTEVPTVAPTEQPTEISGYYLGDVNGDSTVDVIDSTLIQRYLASVAYPDTCVMMHGDVDGDGVVTILDATYIGRYNARIDVRYPIGEWQAE